MDSQTGWYVVITAGIASFAALSSQFRSILSRIVSIVIIQVHVDDSSRGGGQESVIYYANNHMKRIKSGIMTYGGDKLFVRPVNRTQVVVYEQVVDSGGFFWYGWLPILISVGEKPGRQTNYVQNQLTIKTIRFLFDPDKFMLTAAETYNSGVVHKFHQFDIEYVSGHGLNTIGGGPGQPEHPQDEMGRMKVSEGIHRMLHWTKEDIGRPKRPGNPLDYIAMSPEMEKVISNVDFWIKNEDWYRDHGVPWNLNLLFIGGPGTGKSSFGRALAEKYNIPVMCADMSSMTNEDLRRMWARSRVPQMIICEDFDTIFNGRENIASKDKLASGVTFDCFLNCLDGIGRTDGVLFIITTNNPESLDEALAKAGKKITRPGRIDFIVNFAPPSKQGLEKMCHRILKDHPDLWAATVKDGLENNESGAQFQFRCQQIAKEKQTNGTNGF